MSVKADLWFQMLDTQSMHWRVNLQHRFIGREFLSHNRHSHNDGRLIERLLHLNHQNT